MVSGNEAYLRRKLLGEGDSIGQWEMDVRAQQAAFRRARCFQNPPPAAQPLSDVRTFVIPKFSTEALESFRNNVVQQRSAQDGVIHAPTDTDIVPMDLCARVGKPEDGLRPFTPWAARRIAQVILPPEDMLDIAEHTQVMPYR
eukprot:jgi/Tetstr1/462434/TSEL_007432.t1